jgi:hypothetical protein
MVFKYFFTLSFIVANRTQKLHNPIFSITQDISNAILPFKTGARSPDVAIVARDCQTDSILTISLVFAFLQLMQI